MKDLLLRLKHQISSLSDNSINVCNSSTRYYPRDPPTHEVKFSSLISIGEAYTDNVLYDMVFSRTWSSVLNKRCLQRRPHRFIVYSITFPTFQIMRVPSSIYSVDIILIITSILSSAIISNPTLTPSYLSQASKFLQTPQLFSDSSKRKI